MAQVPLAGDTRRARPLAIAAAGRSMGLSLALLALALLGMAAQQAGAANLVSPPDGAHVGSTPTLAWGPSPGEEASLVELSPNRARADDGSFVDDPGKRTGVLSGSQTSYRIPASEPLTAGTWYWHLQTDDFGLEPCCSRWTETRRLVVADEPIRIVSFSASYLSRIDELAARFAYADNSASLFARYRIEFRKRRHGRRLASISGSLDRRNLLDGVALVTGKRPRKLRLGRRYLVRLRLRDAAGHEARTGFRRVKV